METTSTTEQWWYELNGQQIGPITKEEIQSLINEGKLNTESLVWKSGLSEWIKLKNSPLNPNQETGDKHWWYNLNGQHLGPVSNEEIHLLIKAGKLNAESFVWKQGMSNWMPLKHTELAINLDNLSSPPVIVVKKWYNNKTKYWLSLLIWPLFIYATIKTDLYKKETKTIIYIIVGMFLFVAYLIPEDYNNEINSNEQNAISTDDENIFPDGMILLDAKSFMMNGNGWNSNLQWTILIAIDKRILVIGNNLGQESEYYIDDITIEKNYVRVEGKVNDGNVYQRGQYYIFEIRNGSLTAKLQMVTKLNSGDYNVNGETIYKLTERFNY